jgi:hypothetical protein
MHLARVGDIMAGWLIPPFSGGREQRPYVCGQTPAAGGLLRLNLRAHVGVLAAWDLRGDRAAHRRPHRDPHHPGLLGSVRARLPDDPLAREVVLVRARHTTTSACGLPVHRGAECRARRAPLLAQYSSGRWGLLKGSFVPECREAIQLSTAKSDV